VNPILIASLAVGAAAAGGVLLMVRELLPAPPALGAALDRLHLGWPADPLPTAPAGGHHLRRLPVPYESLALLDRTGRDYVLALAAGAAAGLALPMVLAVMAAAAGRLAMSAALVAGGLAAAAASAGCGALVAHLEVTARAGRVRRQFRPVVASYLSLVAMERAAGHGSVESLERAAQVGDGPAVRRIRDALQRARAHHRPPWDELQAVAGRLGVPELADVGQIMRSSGLAGAQVHRTLLQRAQSLRDQIRTDALAQAERTTTTLEVPGVLLLFLLVAYFLYPLTQQIHF
jgi:tight adherence protein C